MLRDKIRKMITGSGKHNMTDYAEYLGRTKQSLNTKLMKNAFNIFDLIDLMEYTGNRLVITDQEGNELFEIVRDDLASRTRSVELSLQNNLQGTKAPVK